MPSGSQYKGPFGLLPVPYSEGVFNFHWFNFYNAICFQIILGAPTVLLAKDLGANSTILGIIAGGGPLPGRVAAAAQAAGRDVFIVALEGFAEKPVVAPWPHRTHRMGAVGQILADLRAHGCRDLVLIGPVRRPSFRDMRPDAEGLRVMARVGRAAFAGDDGLLAAVIRILGEEGFRVIGAHEVVTEVLAPPGLLTVAAPDARAAADIARGVAVVRALGALDIGQACVVQQGLVLAVEAIEGTDAMLARARGLARPGAGGPASGSSRPDRPCRSGFRCP